MGNKFVIKPMVTWRFNVTTMTRIKSKKKLTRTNFSESPLHLLTIVDAEILKNVVLHSVATALARRVFPVPKLKKQCLV